MFFKRKLEPKQEPKPTRSNGEFKALRVSIQTVEELRAIVFPTGKHKGKTYSEVLKEEPHYYYYLIDNAAKWGESDLKFYKILEKELNSTGVLYSVLQGRIDWHLSHIKKLQKKLDKAKR